MIVSLSHVFVVLKRKETDAPFGLPVVPSDHADVLSSRLAAEWSLARERAHANSTPSKPVKPSLFRALAGAYGGPYFVAAIFKLVNDCLSFSQPQLLRLLLKFVASYRTETPDPVSCTRHAVNASSQSRTSRLTLLFVLLVTYRPSRESLSRVPCSELLSFRPLFFISTSIDVSPRVSLFFSSFSVVVVKLADVLPLSPTSRSRSGMRVKARRITLSSSVSRGRFLTSSLLFTLGWNHHLALPKVPPPLERREDRSYNG